MKKLILIILALIVSISAYAEDKATHLEFRHRSIMTEYVPSPVVSLAADVLAITLVGPIISKTTGSDAEAWTLADGKPGQLLIIILAVDGNGTGTLTPTTTTGFSTIAFADALDQAVLYYVDDTVGWIIISVTGLVQPPVVT